MAELPSADEFFGTKKLPTADEFFSQPATQMVDVPGVGVVGDAPSSSAELDNYVKQSRVGHILDAVGQGAKQGWGTGPLGLSDETEQWLRKAGIFNDYTKGQTSLIRAANETMFRPAAAAIDAAWRGSQAAFAGAQAAVAQVGEETGHPQLGRDIAAIPEAFMGSPHPTGVPALPRDIAVARDLKIIGAGEAGWKGTASVAAEEPRFAGEAEALKAQSEAVAKTDKEIGATPQPGVTAGEPTAQPDIHAVARQVAPETFQKFDALTQRRDTFRRWISELQESRDQQVEAQAPHADEIADLEQRMEGATPRLQKKYRARLETLRDERDQYIEDNTQGDSSDMAKIRQRLVETDYAMRDLAPEVGQAYRAAQERMPQEAAPEATATQPEAQPAPQAPEAPQAQEAAPAAIPESVQADLPEAPPEAAAKPQVTPVEDVKHISQDVAQKLIAAGRPEEEAKAAGKLIASHYWARAARFNGEKGSALDLYNAEAPEIKAGRTKARKLELAQRELNQERDVTATPEFKNWFGNSKVTDESGNPQVVYHGTAKKFSAFSKEATPGGITWFTSDKSAIERGEVGAQGKGHVMDLYASIKNPAGWAEYDKYGLDELERMGYDGVILRNKDGSFDGFVFEPEQLKSVQNQGTFSPDTANIYKQSTRTGKISIAQDARNTITLFKDADASTFLHETGHQWLEELLGDAADERAPADLVNDAKTVRDWLGAEGDITRAQHEKFARGFEAYMMEGRAPSTGLARVFEQFRQWLTSIYQTVAKLRSPINDDIRDVFDRLIVAKPEKTVIAPDREVARHFADLHEADAESTPPHEAYDAAERIRQEADRIAREKDAEVADEIDARPSSETGRDAGQNAEAASHGNEAGPAAGEGGANPEPGAVVAGGNETPREGAGARQGAVKTEVPESAQAVLPAPETNLVDKAGNIRLDNLNLPEDVNQVIREAAEQNGGFTEARRGVMSDAEVIDLADALGMTPSDLNTRQIGQAFNAEQIMAARKLLVQSAVSVRDAMAKAASGSDADVMAYAEAKTRHRMIQEQVSGITAEAGRALRAFREISGMKEAQAVSDFVRDATGRTLFQLRQEAQLGLNLDTPAKVSKFVHDSTKPTFGDMVLEYWINGLISGPATHTTYSVGNALLALWRAGPETAAASAVGAIRGALGAEGPRVMIGEVPAQLYGLMRGVRNGVVAAVESAKSGRTTMLPGELENMSARQLQMSPLVNPRASIPGVAGTVARLPSRGIAIIHSFFRAMNYEREMAGVAYRTAALEGLQGEQLAARIGELETNPTPELMQQARASATDLTLMGKGGELTTALTRLTNAKFLGFQWLKFVDPFVHISSNIIEQSLLKRSPVGFLSGEIRADVMGTNGPVAQDLAIGRMVAGSALGIAVGSLAAEGLVNGSGPSDPKERSIYTMVNGPPHSVRIGETWYDVHRLGVLGMLLGVTADLYEVGHMASKDDTSKVASQVMHAFSQNILDESFMRGPSDLIKALTDHDRYGASYVRNFLSSFTPYSVGMGQIARGIDPYSRSARSIMDSVKAKVPWLSETLLPRRDIFGNEIANKEALGVAGLSAIYETKVNNDPVPKAMLRLGVFPAMPTRKIRGVELSDQQYDDYARISGRMLKMRLDAIVNTPGFGMIPDAQARELITKTISSSREAARDFVLMSNPGIIQQATDNKLAIIQGKKTVH